MPPCLKKKIVKFRSISCKQQRRIKKGNDTFTGENFYCFWFYIESICSSIEILQTLLDIRLWTRNWLKVTLFNFLTTMKCKVITGIGYMPFLKAIKISRALLKKKSTKVMYLMWHLVKTISIFILLIKKSWNLEVCFN